MRSVTSTRRRTLRTPFDFELEHADREDKLLPPHRPLSMNPERRTPMRLERNGFTTSRIGVRRSCQVLGPDARPKLEVEAPPEREIRIPKPEIRKKSEARRPKTAARPKFAPSEFGIRASFGLRISDFGFHVQGEGRGEGERAVLTF